MPLLTTIVAVAAVAGMVGTVVQQSVAAKKQAKAAKKQAQEARAAANAAPPAKTTGADVRLAARDSDTKRGKGSLASRRRATSLGLDGPSAASVGGL